MDSDKNHVDLTPDYEKLHTRFKEAAMGTLERFARKSPSTFTRSEVYEFVSTLRVALSCARTVDQIVQLRNEFDAGADKMYEQLQSEQI